MGSLTNLGTHFFLHPALPLDLPSLLAVTDYWCDFVSIATLAVPEHKVLDVFTFC